MSRTHSYSHSRAHSPTFPSLHLRHNSFSNPSVALPTSQLILQRFRRFTYVTAHSPTLPSIHLRHSSFTNPSIASPTPQALHLIHLASRPCLSFYPFFFFRFTFIFLILPFLFVFSFVFFLFYFFLFFHIFLSLYFFYVLFAENIASIFTCYQHGFI